MSEPVALLGARSGRLADELYGLLSTLSTAVRVARSDAEVFESIGEGVDLVVLGPMGADDAGTLAVAAGIRRHCRSLPIILVVQDSTESLAIAALRAHVDDYLRTDELGDFTQIVRRQLAACRGRSPGRTTARLIGNSRAMRDLRQRIRLIAETDSNVLITGPTGTGKELVAELIHQAGPRRDRRMICINCAALPEALLENELFGHDKGAYTGAGSFSAGKLGAADGGTVFLDEIGEMSRYTQAKILRVIEGREVQRLGGTESIHLDIRVIAATNRDLEQLVAAHEFREDLYYRLNVTRIDLPPLRERKEDVAPLCEHYLGHLNERFDLSVEGVSDEVSASLHSYDWPGNVRELKNFLESVFVNRPSRSICSADLPDSYRARFECARRSSFDERDQLLWALNATHWNKSKAAEKLHWSRMTLYRKMAKHDIVRTGDRRKRSKDSQPSVPYQRS